MKFASLFTNVITEQLINEHELPPKFVQIAVREFGMSVEEIRGALEQMPFKIHLKLMNAFNFHDYEDARNILQKAGVPARMGMVPQEGSGDNQDANQDAFDDDFVKWVDANIVGREYRTVYDIFEKMNIDEEPWMALEKMLPSGDSETSVVDQHEIKDFAAMLRQQPQKAIQQYVRTIDSLYDDDDLKSQYSDGVEYDSQAPDGYYNAPR